MTNDTEKLPTEAMLDAGEAAYDAVPEGYNGHRRGLEKAYLAMQSARPTDECRKCGGKRFVQENSGPPVPCSLCCPTVPADYGEFSIGAAPNRGVADDEDAKWLRCLARDGTMLSGKSLARLWRIATRLEDRSSDGEMVERAIEMLAQLEEIDGNKAGAFTLRNEGAIGLVFGRKIRVAIAALSGKA